MMKTVSMMFLIIFMPGHFSTVMSDCGNIAFGKSGKLPSPKGREENCTWEIKSPEDGKNYVLEFGIITHKLSYRVKSKRECAAQLTVNGEPVDCTSHIKKNNPNCTLYYSTSVCDKAVRELLENPIAPCKGYLTNIQTTFPINVTYVSDDNSGFTGSIAGFIASYKFTECTEETTTTTTSVASVTPIRDMITTRGAGYTQPQRAEAAEAMSHGGMEEPMITPVLTNSVTFFDVKSSSTITKTKTGTSVDSSQGSVSIIVATSVPAVLLLALAVIAVICVRKRKQRNTSHGPPIGEESPNPLYQSQNQIFSFTNDSNRPTASSHRPEPESCIEVGVATENNQPRPAESGHVTGNSQSEDVIYSAVNVQGKKKTVHYRKETVESLEPENCIEVGVATENNQPRLAESGHVTGNSQSEDVIYSAVNVQGKKKTVHYRKETVENSLHGTRD